MTFTITARTNVAARYRVQGKHDIAERVLEGKNGFWAIRHEEERLKREGSEHG